MADIPNSRQYRTTGDRYASNRNPSKESVRMQHQQGDVDWAQHSSHNPGNAGSEGATSAWPLLMVVIGVALVCAFPMPAMTVFAIAALATWLLRRK